MQRKIAKQTQSKVTRGMSQFQPLTRTQALLGAIPGIEQDEEKMLFAAIEKQFPSVRNGVLASESNRAIRSYIVGAKFQDPNLERVRKIAAKEWDKTAEMLDRAVDRMQLSESSISGEVAAQIIYGDE